MGTYKVRKILQAIHQGSRIAIASFQAILSSQARL
jgi:hypothetical protein